MASAFSYRREQMLAAFVTRAEAKAICNIRETNKDKDTRIDELIMVASEQIETETGRIFSPGTNTEFFDTRGTVDFGFDDTGWSPDFRKRRVKDSSFFLKGVNIASNNIEVRYDPFREFDDTTIVPAKDFYFDPTSGKLTLLIGTRKAARSLKVFYPCGFDLADDESITLEDGKHPKTMSASLTPMVKEACLLQVGYLYARSRADNIGLTGDRAHGKADAMVQTLDWGSKMGLAPEVIALVREYKRPVMGRY